MVPLTLEQVAAVVEGRLDGAEPTAVVDGEVVLDSRAVRPGGLFAAFVGERADGHDHAAAAVEAGAVAVLASRPVGVPAVVVDDVTTALGRLARAVLDALRQRDGERGGRPLVVGVTGSAGKTGTKDLLAAVLPAVGPVVWPPGSYNNELGVPLTALRADVATEVLVLEMGARGRGHIRALCEVAPPAVGVVLNVGTAHLGEFGSREGIAQAKGELVEALPPEGLAVLNADDDLVRAMAQRTSASVLLVGEAPDADVRADELELDDAARARFRLVAPDGAAAPVQLRLHGEHHVGNALAAAAVALHAGVPLEEVAARLSSARPASRHRMEVVERADGVTVVNDAYNANPDSVRAALKALVQMAHGRRTWAVLGEMLELGDASPLEHDGVGRLAVRLDVSRLVAVGPGARAVHIGAQHEGSWGEESTWVPDVDAAHALLREQLRPGDLVLVKSSRDAGLRELGERLVADAAPEGSA